MLASAVRVAIEPFLARRITGNQRGFLPERAMLANPLDVDERMLEEAAAGEGAEAILLGFAAAFPSIEHRLMLRFFESLGWPAWLLSFVGCLAELQ